MKGTEEHASRVFEGLPNPVSTLSLPVPCLGRGAKALFTSCCREDTEMNLQASCLFVLEPYRSHIKKVCLKAGRQPRIATLVSDNITARALIYECIMSFLLDSYL